MGERLVFIEKDGKTYQEYVETKYHDPDAYRKEQEEMREAYQHGRRYWMKKVFERTCPTCGEVFYTNSATQIYCTIQDKKRARRKKKETAICLHCGEPFETNRETAFYCSNRCRQAAYRYRKTNDNAHEHLTVTHERK